MLTIICFMSLLSYDLENIQLSIDTPKEISMKDTVILTGTLYNNSDKTISLLECGLFAGLYRESVNYEIIIKKGEELYQISMAFWKPVHFPKKIKIKKHSNYSFNIPFLFRYLSSDGFVPLDSIESGEYEIQVIVSLKTPKNTTIKSNIVKCYLNVKEYYLE